MVVTIIIEEVAMVEVDTMVDTEEDMVDLVEVNCVTNEIFANEGFYLRYPMDKIYFLLGYGYNNGDFRGRGRGNFGGQNNNRGFGDRGGRGMNRGRGWVSN